MIMMEINKKKKEIKVIKITIKKKQMIMMEINKIKKEIRVMKS